MNRLKSEDTAPAWTHAVKGTEPVRILTSLFRNLMILIKDYNVATGKSDCKKKSLDEVFQSILDNEANQFKGNKKLQLLCRHSISLLKAMRVCPENDTP